MRNYRTVKKFANQRYRIGGVFLHQPMSRTCDYLLLHVGRYMTHDHSLQRTEGLLSANRHYRHGQLRLFEDLVVLRILRERGELRESCPHSTRLRISSGKEIPGVLVGLTRIPGKVVPYPVKIDSLPPCHQPFRIRPVKVEVPDPGILENLAPRFDPGNWSVHHH